MAEKRELIENPAGKFYAKRNPDGTFQEMDEQHRSLSADAKQKAKTTVKPGHGDRGDTHRKGRRP